MKKGLIVFFMIVLGLLAFVPPDVLLDTIIGPSKCHLITDCYDPRDNKPELYQRWIQYLWILYTSTITYILFKK